MKMKKLLIPLFLCCAVALQAQPEVRPGNETPEFTDHFYTHTRDLIRVPDIPGYTTLKCDFHIHSAYSDGSVWPDVRANSITRIRIPDAQRTTPVLNCLITADETLEAQLPEARIQ